MNGWNQGENEYQRSLAEVAAWERRRPPEPSRWWYVAIGAALGVAVVVVAGAARAVWEMMG